MKISISMITLNEEKNIKRALSSCTFADEIVIVDGGSTDKTLDIIKTCKNAKLIQYPWNDHFGKQRQISLENCTGDWVIRLDADEAFSQQFEENIRALLESSSPNVTGYKIRQCNLLGNENWYSKTFDNYEAIPRIWRNHPNTRWVGQVHEKLVGLEGEIRFWDVYIVHYGFLDKKRYQQKGSYYSRLPSSQITNDGELLYREYDIQPRPERSSTANHVPPFTLDEKNAPKPGIAIIRGPNLNAWEMQNYEPLMKHFDLTAYATSKHNYDIANIKIPTVKLPCHPEQPDYMTGLEYALFDQDLIFTADTTWPFSYQAVSIKEKLGKKVVCLQWENIPFAYEDNEQIKQRKSKVRQMADHFVAVTERAKEALVLEGVTPDRITVIPMGVDIGRFKPDQRAGQELREQFGLTKNEKVILFTGRMVWEKGIYDLVSAAKLTVHATGDAPIRFVVVGAGPESEGFKQLILELELTTNFLLIDNYPHHDIHMLYNIADIFVLPSISTRFWKEQFGMVLVEAMASGVPVISTLSGSIPEVVRNAGILVQANDPGSLSSAIVELVKNDELRQDFSKRGRKRAENKFDSKKIAARIGTLFETILGNTNLEFEIKSTTSESPDLRKEVLKETSLNNPAKFLGIGFDNSLCEISKPNQLSTNSEDCGYYAQERHEVESIIPRDAAKILDVGCGEGILGKRILERGAQEVIGIEIRPDICERASENLTRAIRGNVEEINLPFEERHFDCIVLADILEHLKEPLITLKKLGKYLSDTGTIVASIPNVRFYTVINMLAEGRWKYEDYGILDKSHLRFFTKKEIERLFISAGYEIQGITENIDPTYHTLEDPLSDSISFGRISLNGLNPDELKDLFVFQYLIKAQKAGHEIHKLDNSMKKACEADKLHDARVAIENYLERHPGDTDILLKHAEVCSRLKLLDKALGSLEKILIFEPERQDALNLRKEILEELDTKMAL